MARVGWVVDCQWDFMDPSGRLYVKDLFDDGDPGANQITATLVDAVTWMRGHCDALVFTGDWHALDDAEIDAISADPALGTYPPHCMGRSEDPQERAGAQIIGEIAPPNPVVVAFDAQPEAAEGLVREALTQKRDLFLQKNRFDVFVGNSASEAVVAALEAQLAGAVEFVVIGVARDVCVTQAIDGMHARGHRTVALSDATWGLGLEAEAETLARWAECGRVTTLSDLERG